jgi:sec-independent protein translocase protein TatA
MLRDTIILSGKEIFNMLGTGEIILIGGLIVLMFGATQIPKVARSLGEGLKEFKKSVKEAKSEDEELQEEKEKKSKK